MQVHVYASSLSPASSRFLLLLVLCSHGGEANKFVSNNKALFTPGFAHLSHFAYLQVLSATEPEVVELDTSHAREH